MIPFSSHALTSKTTNIIHGSVPYLTYDGGHTRIVDTEGLLSITLSNGMQYTPSTNNSSRTPIELPEVGQSFADIGMMVPTNTDFVELNTLVDSPYNYWGDDDGDGDVTATGTLSLSIEDKYDQPVSRDTVLSICNAPYRVELVSTEGSLTTRYGIPNSRSFSAGNVTYYINAKVAPEVCFARPNLALGDLNENGYDIDFRGPASIWNPSKGFLTQTLSPLFYGQNFPTTGANNLYFDLDIIGSDQPLSWSPVSHGGITATMTNSTATSVRVTLTGPVASSSQWASNPPDSIAIPTLPQIFELVGRDSQGNKAVKYGFELKQWFVNRGTSSYHYSDTLSWCNSLGYRMVKIKDLTNAVRSAKGETISGATPSSSGNYYQRQIGAGLFTEWGNLSDYTNSNFNFSFYWTNDPIDRDHFVVSASNGAVGWFNYYTQYGLCVSP
ncbi:hypothetical protein [Gilliamella sp. ESL0443]|uniref:hypothetical protein n=1 Tax=Gilliamella sp. ESL0443 TaxID=2704655 RepID=UPI001C6981F7|nr:hypothetical protein [Gilliamella sp. ESL0443]QYN41830.1 hypothetical protein GYM76_03290 [Gilliamella sp. ESL0443]